MDYRIPLYALLRGASPGTEATKFRTILISDDSATNPVVIYHSSKTVRDGQNCALSEFTERGA
jgi:hypothetical protein